MKKNLNILKLVIANIFIISLFTLILLLTPDNWRINLIIIFCYSSFTLLFNLYITER